jgi:hypothetical protein
MWLWLALAMAWADDLEKQHWEQTQQALLDEALTGNLERAAVAYTLIADAILPAVETRQLKVADASLPQSLLWLGHAMWSMGDVAGAREALDRCIRAGIDKGPCLDLRSRIDLDVDAVHEVPLTWTFETADHGFFHARSLWHRGSLRLKMLDDTSVLEWSTTVDGSKQDELVVGLRDPYPEPKSVRLVARSEVLDGALQIVLEDTEGHVFVSETKPIRFDKGVVVDVQLRVDAFRSAVPGGPALDPSRLHRLRIRDATGLTGQLGSNIWSFDLFEVQ